MHCYSTAASSVIGGLWTSDSASEQTRLLAHLDTLLQSLSQAPHLVVQNQLGHVTS